MKSILWDGKEKTEGTVKFRDKFFVFQRTHSTSSKHQWEFSYHEIISTEYCSLFNYSRALALTIKTRDQRYLILVLNSAQINKILKTKSNIINT